MSARRSRRFDQDWNADPSDRWDGAKAAPFVMTIALAPNADA